MNTLTEFSEKEREYHAYQARQNFLRQQKSIARRIEALTEEAARARAEREQARMVAERERQEKAAALAEIARLKALLENSDRSPS